MQQPSATAASHEIADILRQAKELAIRYRALTGKPLGVTGEVAEYEAVRLLDYKLCDARQCGFDAWSPTGRRAQIKGRVLQKDKDKSPRLGGIDITQEFDTVLMVLMDQDFNTTAVYEADRSAVIEAITKPGSKARNERGQLGIDHFRKISTRVWPV